MSQSGTQDCCSDGGKFCLRLGGLVVLCVVLSAADAAKVTNHRACDEQVTNGTALNHCRMCMCVRVRMPVCACECAGRESTTHEATEVEAWR